MPKGLIEATNDYNNRKIDEPTWLKRIKERERYLAKPNGKPREDGSIRYLHPTDHGRPVCNPNRKNAPAFCQQKTLLVPREHLGLKYRQKFRYKTAEWERNYRTSRSTNEGFNGFIKRADGIAIDQPQLRRVRGFAAQYVAVAMKLAAANIEIIRGFLSRTPEITATILEKRNKRRLGTSTARNYKATRDHGRTATARKPLVPLRK